MRHFILKVLILSTALFFLFGILDKILSNSLRKTNLFQGECEVWNDIYNSKIDCEVAIYGSSRAWVQVNPEIIESETKLKTYNFGIDGHNFNMQYLRHLEYLRLNPSPKIIVLCLGAYSLEKRVDFYNMEQILPFMLWNSNIKKITNDYIGIKNRDFYIPLIRYSGQKKAIKESVKIINGKKEFKHRKKGFRSSNDSWSEKANLFLQSNDKYLVKIDTQSVSQFENFIAQCKTQKIQLYLFYTPEYFKGQSKIVNRAEIISLYEKIANEKDVVFVDFSKNRICRDKSLFYNTLHLNSKGSIKFTKMIADALKKKG